MHFIRTQYTAVFCDVTWNDDLDKVVTTCNGHSRRMLMARTPPPGVDEYKLTDGFKEGTELHQKV